MYNTLIADNRWILIVNGLRTTLIIAFFSLIIGVALGLVIAMIKVAAMTNKKLKFLSILCNIYINVIRGTPIVVQLMIMYFVILVAINNAIVVAIISFGLNSAAYVAEVVRAGILAVDKGQTEAGRSLGLSKGETMKSIVLPQAIKNILPALCNEFIALLKETSVAGYIAIQDLTKAGDVIRSRTFDAFIPLLIIAAIYLVLVLGLAYIVRIFERKLARSDNR